MSEIGAVAARADSLIALGRSAEAMTLLTAALASEPDSAQLLRQLARVHLLAKQPDQARVVAERAVMAEPDSEWGFRILSQAYDELDNHWEAMRAAAEAQRLAPFEWRAHVRRAVASAQADRPAEAMAAAYEAVRLAPDEAEAHFAVGYAARANRDLPTAEKAYLNALAIDPTHATALNNLGSLRMRQRGGLRKATRGFGAALAVDAQLSVARNNLDIVARRYMRRFHFAAVVVYFVLGLSFSPARAPGAPDLVSGASRVQATVVGVLALLVLLGMAVVVDRQLPANLRPYFRRLPRTDRWFGLWLLMDLAALLVICGLGVATTYSGRSNLVTIGWVLLVGGLVVSYGPRLAGRASSHRARR